MSAVPEALPHLPTPFVAHVLHEGNGHFVVVHEVKKTLLGGLSPDELTARIKVAVVKAFDVPTPCVVLTNRGAVQRTTSGKVQRQLMRTLFLQQRLPVLHEDVAAAVQALRDPAPAAIG